MSLLSWIIQNSAINLPLNDNNISNQSPFRLNT